MAHGSRIGHGFCSILSNWRLQPKLPSSCLRVVYHALKINYHDRVIADDPRIMPSRQHGHLAGLYVLLRTVVSL